ncbi:sugar phosphate isomerase/epimerase family protein [Halomarina oriensis]|uniref:TIM barrel protein n=1 Tax=Halomarina oriensis TaxID=671145 RepID=A0A6B0GJM0_9EURY|nr:sugar phosphate isomerase/epimerase [Halomarina oriensis]MWG35004.1 TIM barrel protein [Halomarina oriensis]
MTMQPALYSRVLGNHTVEDAISTAASLGYPGFDLMARAPHLPPDADDATVDSLKRALDDQDLGLACVTTYTGGYVGRTDEECEADLAALEPYLEFADALGCDLLRHGPNGPPPYEATDDEFEQAARWMRRAADLAAEYDKRLGIEIHAGKLCETTDSTLDLLARIDRENVGALHDAGNLYIADAPYGAESIDALGDRLFHVHVKDLERVDDTSHPDISTIGTRHGDEPFRSTLLGEGAVEFDRVFDALADAGYDGYVTAERPPLADTSGEAVAEHELAALNRLIERVE